MTVFLLSSPFFLLHSVCFQKASDKSAVDRIFKDLDSNKDNTVDFKEYVTLVSCLTVMCNEFFVNK